MDQIRLVFLVGLAAALALYLAPSGVGSMQSARDLEIRFVCALAISWLAALRVMPAVGPGVHPALVLSGLAGVSAPLLLFASASFMVCGAGQPTCAV